MSPVLFPPPPSTSNTFSSQQRAARVRSAKKLTSLLGDVPRVVDDDTPPLDHDHDAESTWRKRKPTHLPPLLKLPTTAVDVPDSPNVLTPSVLSVTPSAASTSSASDTHTDAAHRRTKLERLRRKLGHEVPATAVFPTTPPHTAVPAPLTPRTAKPPPRARSRSRSRTRTRSVARLPGQADDARSVAFSISSDESVHTVALTASRVHSPRPHKTKHVYQTGALPPIPPIPAHLASPSSRHTAPDEDDVGLIHPRQKVPAGSKIGGTDFKAAQRAKRERRALHGTVEPGELIEMVGFLGAR